MGSNKDISFKTKLLQLECHFTWALNKEDTDLTDLLNRLKEQIDYDLGKEAGIVRTYNSLGFVKFLLGSQDEALDNFQRSVKLTKEHHGEDCEKLLVVSYGNLAWLHYHMGAYEECESYLNKLKEIKEKQSLGKYPEVLGEKGWIFLKFSNKYYERAKECFREALELEPEDGELNTGYAIALYRIHSLDYLYTLTHSPVIKQLRRAIDMNPDDDVLKVLLGLKLTGYKKSDEAESLVLTALKNSPDHPHVMRYVGKFFRKQGSVERAITLLNRALNIVPNSSFIHHQLALSYKTKITNSRQAGSHHSRGAEIQRIRNQLIYHLEKATTLRPSFILAMSELALQYGENKETSKAEKLFQDTFIVAKEKNDAHQVVNFTYADFQLYSVRCEPLAIKLYKEALKMGPHTAVGKKCTWRLKMISERRIDKNHEDGEAYGILGFMHKENRKIHQAIECYEKALCYEDNEEYLSDLCELRLSLQ